jgi:ankyrin repeat protein
VQLHIATQEGHTGAVRFLVEKGARTDIINEDEKTPFQLATDGEILDYLKALQDHNASSSSSSSS